MSGAPPVYVPTLLELGLSRENARLRDENATLVRHAEQLARLVYDHRSAWHELAHEGPFFLCEDDGCRLIAERYGPLAGVQVMGDA